MPHKSLSAFGLHPRLLLDVPRGRRAVIARHALMEMEKARRIYRTSPEADLPGLFNRLATELCPNYKGFCLYAVVRRCNAHLIVETGVASGVSSFSILQALEDIGQGSLFSIDLREPEEGIGLPEGVETGFLVPDSLRGRWTLIRGDSRQELPRLLEKLGTIDLFIHDSLHTYDHMMFEFEEAWPKLRTGGILFSDDISQNNAFHDFCAKRNLQGIVAERTEFDWKVEMGWVVKP